MRRGLTMIELLVALGLLSALTLAVASWIRVTAGATAQAAGPLRFRLAAEAALRMVHDDLASGDFGRSDRDRNPRVEVEDGGLRIETRSVRPDGTWGPVTNRYVFDPPSGSLRLEQRSPDGRRSSRLLLQGVASWSASIDEEVQRLTVSASSEDGIDVQRTYRLR